MQIKIIVDWFLNAEYSCGSIQRIFEHAQSLGYSFFIYEEDFATRKNLSAEDGAYHAFEGYKQTESQINYIFAERADVTLSLTFHSEKDELNVSSGFRTYLEPFDQISAMTKGYNNPGGWEQISDDLHDYDEILSIFQIKKCRFAQENYVEEDVEILGENIPAIGVLSGIIFSIPDCRVSFLRYLVGQEFQIYDEQQMHKVDPIIALEEREHCYIISLGDVHGKLFFGPSKSGRYWFAPEPPYKMRQYANEYAIDTGFYTEFAFNMCPAPISILETEGFENVTNA